MTATAIEYADLYTALDYIDRCVARQNAFWWPIACGLELWKLSRDLRQAVAKHAGVVEQLEQGCRSCQTVNGCALMDAAAQNGEALRDIIGRATDIARNRPGLAWIHRPYVRMWFEAQGLCDRMHVMRTPGLRQRIEEATAGIDDIEDASDVIAAILAQDEMERGEKPITIDELKKELSL